MASSSTSPPIATLLTSPQEGQLLRKLRIRLAATRLRQLLTTDRLRVSIAVLLSMIFWGGLFWLALEGFYFLHELVVDAYLFSSTVQFVFGLFFSSLMIMLIFSTGIILYGGLFRSLETGFLLTTPASAESIFAYKFQEAIFFSSWGFILLSTPLVFAYGVVADAPWHYYLIALPMMLSFVYLPASIGAMLCLFLVHQITHIRFYATVLGSLLALGVFLWGGWALLAHWDSDLLTEGWIQEMITRMQNTERRWLPSWWLTSGLLEAARHDTGSLKHPPWAHAMLFFALLFSQALFFNLLATKTAHRLLRGSYSRMQTMRTAKRRIGTVWIDRVAMLVAMPFSRNMQVLLLKDFRIFRRDPVQWTQFFIFLGLVAFYFLAVPQQGFHQKDPRLLNLVSFLNVAVVGLILSTFTTRFIFPLISLEGQRFWILGRLPVRRETILLSKFVFSTICSLIPASLLIGVSDLMLGVEAWIAGMHQLIALILSTGLAGIAVGLGAKMPDLRETNPSKIAAGFGGTLNLVLSAVFITVVVGAVALPSHFYIDSLKPGSSLVPHRSAIANYLALGIGVSIVCGALATLVPLRIGTKAFVEMEV